MSLNVPDFLGQSTPRAAPDTRRASEGPSPSGPQPNSAQNRRQSDHLKGQFGQFPGQGLGQMPPGAQGEGAPQGAPANSQNMAPNMDQMGQNVPNVQNVQNIQSMGPGMGQPMGQTMGQNTNMGQPMGQGTNMGQTMANMGNMGNMGNMNVGYDYYPASPLRLSRFSNVDWRDTAPFQPASPFSNYDMAHFEPQRDSFNLPLELQGGIGTISSRRPSYAAELFTRNSGPPVPGSKNSLASFAAANNYNMTQSRLGFDALADSLQSFSFGTQLANFQARRPSQLADLLPYPPPDEPQFAPLSPYTSPGYTPYSPKLNGSPLSQPAAEAPSQPALDGQAMKLENGLMVRDQYIMASTELKTVFLSVARYFQDDALSDEILTKLKALLASPVVMKLVIFIKSLNDLTFNHKMLCLVANKNGKLDLLSYPNNSNIYLQKEDLVIVDGDRGKDLVMILEPLVSLDMAILFNFLRKIEHLKSLTISDGNGGSSVKNNHTGGTHSTALNASAIINNHSNNDNEFIISLPTKQVLRFATPKEVQKLSKKFLEEKKAFVTCYNKIKELGLSNNLTLINVEYQSDFKKLIFYYFANFKRIDFRGLIKELFKIYKTRIWLCAVLPYDRPELYTNKKDDKKWSKKMSGGIPTEYNLLNDQIMNFSISEFANLEPSSYFHLRNMLNLIENVEEDAKGNFYGFHVPGDERRKSEIQPSFNPFGDD